MAALWVYEKADQKETTEAHEMAARRAERRAA